MRTITESESTPRADGFFMPAEFAPQDRVWMGWPHRTDTWAHGAKPAQKQYAAIARAIAEFTPVYMCANQVDYANCKAVFENDENVTVVEMTTDDAWFRDTGATYVIDGKGGKRANHWHFNGYGGLIDGLYFPWDKDEQIALKMAELSGCRRYRPDDMILEGGSITVDGEGLPLRLDTRLAWDLLRVRPIVRLDIPGQTSIQLPKVPGRIRGRLDRSIHVPAYLITALE